MNVPNVAKPSARGQPFDYICGSIQERNRTSVRNVGRPSAGNPASASIKEFTWRKRPDTAAPGPVASPPTTALPAREKPHEGTEGTWKFTVSYGPARRKMCKNRVPSVQCYTRS